MKRPHSSYACAALAAVAALAAGASFATDSVPLQKDVEIPFANRGGIRDWQADRDRGVWVQDAHQRWYYAELMGPCLGLNFANTLAFDTRPSGTFDRFSSIIVPRDHSRCSVKSLRMSGPPPSHHNKQANIAPPPPEG
jgi:Family of unknown function (DUF6491)